MALTLTATDEARLAQAHPDLVKVVRRYLAIGSVPIMISESVRTLAQQKKNKALGVSWTLRSRHLPGRDGLSRALDIVPLLADGRTAWALPAAKQWAPFLKLAPQMKRAAADVGVTVEWGGDWKRNKDGPHWQLPWKKYP